MSRAESVISPRVRGVATALIAHRGDVLIATDTGLCVLPADLVGWRAAFRGGGCE